MSLRLKAERENGRDYYAYRRKPLQILPADPASRPDPHVAQREKVSSMSDLLQLRDALRKFAAEREWDQFHSPKNLAMALAVGAAS